MITVKVTGCGTMVGAELTRDASTHAECTLCSSHVEAVASVGKAFVCAVCLRDRLDALSVGRFRLREGQASQGIPWGKVSG